MNISAGKRTGERTMHTSRKIRAAAVAMAIAVTGSLMALAAPPAGASTALGVQTFELNPGTGAGATPTVPMIVFNGALYFQGTNPTSGAELWKSDGTFAGTVL